MDNLDQPMLNRRKIHLAILMTIGLLLIASFFMVNKNIQESSLEKTISRAAGTTDLQVSGILFDIDGWKLVKVQPVDDKGNISFVVVAEKDGVTSVKLGPGTYFSQSNLKTAGLPEKIQAEIRKHMRQSAQ